MRANENLNSNESEKDDDVENLSKASLSERFWLVTRRGCLQRFYAKNWEEREVLLKGIGKL